MRNPFICAILALVTLVSCASPATQTIAPTFTPNSTSTVSAPVTNITNGCVQQYDSNTDYFPEKVTVEYASGFTIEYFKNYKVVSVLDPYADTQKAFQYILVQCGTPAPEGFDQSAIVEVPIRSIITLSSSYLPFLKALGLYDRLVGVDTVSWIYDPDVLQKAKDGKLIEVGFGAEVNIEQVLNLNPDLIMTGIYRQSKFNNYPLLSDAGLKVVINTDFLESTPLGRAEWIKFMGVFFNQEQNATEFFTQKSDRYGEIATLANGVTDKPSVLWGVPGKDTWYVPGGRSFEATLFADAGARYWWENDTEPGKIPLAFEAVFDTAADSDYWLAADGYPTLSDMLTADSRLSSFTATANNRVWSNDARVNDAGGNDYWESGVVNPDIVLADLIKIFHPELLPDHELVYWRLLK